MRAAKSYLAAHPSWFNESSDITCPRCGSEPESFQHAILTCPAQRGARNLLLNEVSSQKHGAELWPEPHLIRALGEYITVTKTGLLLDMILDYPPTPTPPSLSPT